jgi:chitin disaccharide deacetylase
VSAPRREGLLIVNADDWGRDRETTDRTLECVKHRSVSAVSAMVFMEDSQRGASVALEHSIDAGLHLNFTSPLTAGDCPARVAEQQRRLTAYLRANRLAQLVFNPLLAKAFDYVVKAQIDEFRRLYGADPARLDGHHHMHLCANVLWQGLLPPGTIVRRNFSFRPGEKSIVNRTYRRFVDDALARRHRLVDHLFSIAPMQPFERVQRVFSLAQREIVELETHPVNPDEHAFLVSPGFRRSAGMTPSTFRSLPRDASGQEIAHERV